MQPLGPGLQVIPLRTPTLAPATHTNTYVVGEGELTVFDPASPWEDEQERLAQELEYRFDAGERLERIVLTHHHDDHVAGAIALQRRFSSSARPIPIAAHPSTAALLDQQIPIDEFLLDAAILCCGEQRLQVHHTPGHAPGHLVFLERQTGAMIAGDMVAGVGTILIDPEDGDLAHYLASLDAMRRCTPTVLLPAHGDPLHQADAVLAFYIAHRHQRTEQVRQGLDRLGRATPADLAPQVYPELDASALPIAAVQILSHLRWMSTHGLATQAVAGGLWELTTR